MTGKGSRETLDNSRFTEAIRDPVWKHVWLTPELRDLTLSAPFLRLYGIKQLGPTDFVYPGATHTRASHSIGVYHVALRLLRVLAERCGLEWTTETGRASFLAAALLHDLGHFPFTHSLKELPLEDHETLTARAVLLEPLASLCASAGADPGMVASVIDRSICCTDPEVLFFRKLLSGVLDPDKLDYLNRDAYYCGVPYGIQDTDFILSHVTAERDKGLVVDSRAIMSVESVLFSKYLMYRSVYWHKNVRIATAMMKKALFSALDGARVVPEDLYSLDDEGVYALLASIGGTEASISAAVRGRALYRTLAEFDVPEGVVLPIEDLSARAVAEREITRLASTYAGREIGEGSVIVDIPERISFESDLPISDEGVPFSESSTVFSGPVVGRFVSSLRKIRIAVEPSLAAVARIDVAELANSVGLGYN